jgi:DNA-binding protein HU-beta
MAERIDKPELVGRVARRLDRDGEAVAEIVDGFLEEIYAALKGGEGVSLRGFGSFYVRPEPDSWVFKFNPSQRLRALLVGRRPTAGRCEPTMTGLERQTVQWVQEPHRRRRSPPPGCICAGGRCPG